MNPAEIVAAVLGILLVALILARCLILDRRRRPADADAEIEDVAQAIAHCYGHGPLRVMDPAYRHEFRRDARAAIAAMRRRP